MRRDRGFCVHGVMTSTLVEMQPDLRAALLGYSFALTFDLGDYELPKKWACFAPLARGIADAARQIIEDSPAEPKSGAQRTAEWRARKRASVTNVTRCDARDGVDVTNVTRCDARDGVTLERKNERMNDIPPTPKGVGGGDRLPPAEVRAELNARRPSADEIAIGAHDLGVPAEFAQQFVDEMEATGWVYVNRNGKTVYVTKANWKTVLKGRFNFAKKNDAARVDDGEAPRCPCPPVVPDEDL